VQIFFGSLLPTTSRMAAHSMRRCPNSNKRRLPPFVTLGAFSLTTASFVILLWTSYGHRNSDALRQSRALSDERIGTADRLRHYLCCSLRRIRGTSFGQRGDIAHGEIELREAELQEVLQPPQINSALGSPRTSVNDIGPVDGIVTIGSPRTSVNDIGPVDGIVTTTGSDYCCDNDYEYDDEHDVAEIDEDEILRFPAQEGGEGCCEVDEDGNLRHHSDCVAMHMALHRHPVPSDWPRADVSASLPGLSAQGPHVLSDAEDPARPVGLRARPWLLVFQLVFLLSLVCLAIRSFGGKE